MTIWKLRVITILSHSFQKAENSKRICFTHWYFITIEPIKITVAARKNGSNINPKQMQLFFVQSILHRLFILFDSFSMCRSLKLWPGKTWLLTFAIQVFDIA